MRRFNWQIWAGFLLTFGGFLSFPFFFVRFPATRDVPWVNFLLAAFALMLLVIGLKRAFQPGRSKLAKVIASVLATLSIAFRITTAATAHTATRAIGMYTQRDQDRKTATPARPPARMSGASIA